jgi:biotin-dependent carboxylase-like uncharacterized protein
MGGMSAALTILEAGPSSTFQDAGRFGFLRYGIAPAGPCDTLLHAIGNRLVGNSIGTATIEFTLKGDHYRITGDSCRIAVAGDFPIEIDGQRMPAWRSHTLRGGQTLSVGYAARGVRGYLAVAGGFDLVPELGSLSVHTRSGIGPLGGSVLKRGEVIPLKLDTAPSAPEQEFDISVLPASSDEIRVVLGPQDQYFSAEDLARFTRESFALSPKCDRMGYQLSGPKMDYRRDLPLISEAIALGSIQVLGDGLYIVALVDRQTVGGYPKIATVVSTDIPALTQSRAGAGIRFRVVSIAEAQALSRSHWGFIQSLDDHIHSPSPSVPNSEALLALNLISGVYFDS